MNNKLLTGFFAFTTTSCLGLFSLVTPARASGFTWGNWNTATSETKDKSTDESGFQSLIPLFQSYVQQERVAIPDNIVNTIKLDPNTLQLKFDHHVRVWFINEGAAYQNQLAYESINASSHQKGLVFDEISCVSDCQLSNGTNAPLEIGDYVDLGKITAGSQLNFFLKADGKNGGTNIYGADTTQNPDQLQHWIAYLIDNQYLLMGVEDLFNGGDKDYNDAVIVVDFGKGNLVSVPEPSYAVAILGVAAVALFKVRQQRGQLGRLKW
jgi:hypothetical protein